MIIHVFTADRYHLVPSISKTLLERFPDKDFAYILCGPKNLNKELYVETYSKCGFPNYVFCHSMWSLVKLMVKYRNNPILFHAGTYSWLIVAQIIAKNVNWVCWGGEASKSKSFIGSKLTWLKRIVFHRYNSIVTLLEGDEQSIIRDFGVDKDRVRTLSYLSSTHDTYSELYKELRGKDSDKNKKPLVLLGNNSSNIDMYLRMLPILKEYSGKIRVECMLNYALEKSERYLKLLSLGSELFGDDFSTDEVLRPFDEYVRHMSECDVYVCDSDRQTGLGAIATSLLLGKKIFITGKNYQWMTSHYKALVFDSKSIVKGLQYEDFIKGLSSEEKEHNANCIVQERATREAFWRKYFSEIE